MQSPHLHGNTMINDNDELEEEYNRFKIVSRREIVALLRSLIESNQLVRMIFAEGADAVVTSVLEVHEAANLVVVDCAPGRMQNERIAQSSTVSFETVLEKIRILFQTNDIQQCEFEGRAAFCFAIPVSVVRLQRREFFRVLTPRCTIQIPMQGATAPLLVNASVQNISAGGLCIVDDKKQLDDTIGRLYENCRIVLPGGSILEGNLQVRNYQEISVGGGKTIKRIGCLFVDLSKPMTALLQRYITQLQREQNAKATGMA